MNSLTATVPDLKSGCGLALQPDAGEFCEKHQLHGLVELAGQIALGVFNIAGPIEVELQVDPDSDEQRPLLVAPVIGTVDEVCKQYDEFVRLWVVAVPPDRSLGLVLSPHIVGNG